MDKDKALNISRNFLKKVLLKNYDISQVWLFGSTAKDLGNENSDIDLAIFLKDDSKTFEKEVELMTLRTGEEVVIEPHLFNNEDISSGLPLVNQILQTGFLVTSE
jgi:predicted nucleotidyltransferase